MEIDISITIQKIYAISPKILFIIFWHKEIFLWRYCRDICENLNPSPCLEHNLVTKTNINLLPCLSETRRIDLSRPFGCLWGEVGQVRPCPGGTVPCPQPLEPVSHPWQLPAINHGHSSAGLLSRPTQHLSERPAVPPGGRAHGGTRASNPT